jgi:hypothetical protein
MQASSSRRRRGWPIVWAALAGAALGSISGPVKHAAAVWVWLTEWAATVGSNGFALVWAGFGVVIGRTVLIVLAVGLLRRCGWARWAALAPPTVFLLVSVAVVGLVLLPSTARDVWSGQPPLRGIDRGPEGSPP